MGKVLTLVIVIFTVGVTTTKASDISECLASAGINVSTNLIERKFGNDTAYVDINFQWQERGEHRLPLAYLMVRATSDVQFAVKCARKLGLAVVTRGGGHGYLKYAYGQNDDKTLVVDLQHLSVISVNQEKRIATIGAGARLGHVAYQLWENGNFYIPYGVCSSVGISGFTLGGGFSHFAHLHGMASDNVIEMEMVNANGDLLTINNSTNSNLFWALRGAGVTGSFGIVTKFVYEIHPAPHRIVYGSVGYSLQRFHEFYSIFQTFESENRGKPIGYIISLSATGVSGSFRDVQNTTEAQTVGVSTMEELLDLFPSPDSRPVIDIVPFRQFLTNFMRDSRSFGYIQPNINVTEPSDLMNVNSYGSGSEWFKAKSIIVRKLLNADEIMSLQQLLIDVSVSGIYAAMETYGGRIHEFDAQIDSAFVHRDAYYNLVIYMIREKEDDAETSRRLLEFFENSKPILNHTSSYQNYPDDEMSDFLDRYYGANLPRLIDIKTEVDPDDFFNTNLQSIPVRGSGAVSNSRIAVRFILYPLCIYLWSIIQRAC